MFSSANYICVLYGLDWFDVDKIDKEFQSYVTRHKEIGDIISQSRLSEYNSISLGHREYIELILRQKS
jgi:hypothetical protein